MMDKIRKAIADKVLEISSSETYDLKAVLQKINRFRDLIEACQSIIKKYPEIEDELLEMIQNNDFDARVASSKIDSIIRLTEKNTVEKTIDEVNQDITSLEHIVEVLSYNNQINNIESALLNQPIEKDVNHNFAGNKNVILESSIHQNYQSTEKIIPDPDLVITKNSEYIDFEEVKDTEDVNIDTDKSIEQELPKDDIEDQKMSTTKKILYIIITIAAIVIIYYIALFIITNWKTILWILAGCTIFFALVWYLMKGKKL